MKLHICEWQGKRLCRTSKGAWIEISNALALKRSADVDTQLEVSTSAVSNKHVKNIKWREIE
ncbi:hypothetical protein P4V01_22630 [Bacillus thuringiensis]|nr:hypothetical protein [Bacillus thuringiensis]